LNSGPLVLPLIGGGAAEVTGLFTAMALFRAPHLVTLGLASRLTGPLTRLSLDDPDREGRLVRGLAAASGAGAAAAAVFGYLAGEPMVRVVFGIELVLRARHLAGLAVGSAVAVGALLLGLVAIARSGTATITVAWTVGLCAGLLTLALPLASPVDLVVAAFVVAELVAFACLLAALLVRSRAARRS
jgi:hypothetical protein